jgi:hypothetical protein
MAELAITAGRELTLSKDLKAKLGDVTLSSTVNLLKEGVKGVYIPSVTDLPVESSMAVSLSAPQQAIEVFFSYAHKDEGLRNELANHLILLERQGIIASWHDRQIPAGNEWAGDIDAHLQTAHIILLLVSSDFLASNYCYDIEVRQAMARHEAGEARVIPIILRAVEWHHAPFGKLQALPKDCRPVTSWSNQDEAFMDVARGIRAVAEAMVHHSKGLFRSAVPNRSL